MPRTLQLPESPGKTLYQIFHLGQKPVPWNGLGPDEHHVWNERAHLFMQEMNTQSSQHFSHQAELAVRGLRTLVEQTDMWTGELESQLRALFDLLPDPDMPIIRKMQEIAPITDETARKLIDIVRDA